MRELDWQGFLDLTGILPALSGAVGVSDVGAGAVRGV